MALQNVEKLEVQQAHEKNWFQRFRGKASIATATVVAFAVSTGTQAFMTGAEVDAATGGAGGETLLQKAGVWILGFVVGMTLFAMLVSKLKKK